MRFVWDVVGAVLIGAVGVGLGYGVVAMLYGFSMMWSGA